MTDDLKTLLTDLVDDQPQPGIDLDRQIARGRRRARRRNLAAGAGAAALVAGVIAGSLTLRPASTPAEVVGPSPSNSLLAVCDYPPLKKPPTQVATGTSLTGACPPGSSTVPPGMSISTARSRALIAELKALAPEYRQPTFNAYDGQGSAGGRLGTTVGARLSGPDQRGPRLLVQVAPAGTIDDGTTCMSPEDSPCTTTSRTLADGSKATIRSARYPDGNEMIGIILVRPDGTQVRLDNGWPVPEHPADPDLGVDRMVQIAEKITTRPGEPIAPSIKSLQTETSKALAAQLTDLTPEIAATPGAQLSDNQWQTPDAKPLGHVHAESVWTYPATLGQNMVYLSVEVRTGDQRIPDAVCTGMDAPEGQRCTEVRDLPGGATAYIHTYDHNAAHHFEVRLERSGGTQVVVSTGAQVSPGSDHQTPLTAERVLEIAQGITVTP